MSNYIVDGDDLTDIADAIRAKTGGSASLAFPADFISEIGDISGGGSSLTEYTGSYTPAATSTTMTITGLDNPAMIVEFAIEDNALDGTTKILYGLFADGATTLMRTNGSGTGNLTWTAPYSHVMDGRTVYEDGFNPSSDEVCATETGFVVRVSSIYTFKTGYTWNWRCLTYPED